MSEVANMNTHNLDYRTTIDPKNNNKDVMYENKKPGDNVHQLLDKNVLCMNSELIQDRKLDNTSSRDFIKYDHDELEDGELNMENHQLLWKYGRTTSTPNIVTMSKESNQDVPYMSTKSKSNCLPIDLTNSDEDEFEEGELKMGNLELLRNCVLSRYVPNIVTLSDEPNVDVTYMSERCKSSCVPIDLTQSDEDEFEEGGQKTENLQLLRNHGRTIPTPNSVTMTKEPSQDATCISTRSKPNCLPVTKASHNDVNCNPVKAETLVHQVSKESNVDVICKSTQNESNCLLEYRHEHTNSKLISTKTNDLPEVEESDVDLLYSYYTCVSPDRSEEKLCKEIKSEPWINLSDLQGILPGDTVKVEDDFKMTQSPTKCDRDVMKQEYTDAFLGTEQYSRENMCVQNVNTDQTNSSSRSPDQINDFNLNSPEPVKPRISTESNNATWQPVVILKDLGEIIHPNYFKQENTFSPLKRKRGPEDIQSCKHRVVPTDSSRCYKSRAWPSISTGTVSLDTVSNPGGKTKTYIGKGHISLPHVNFEIVTVADIDFENTLDGNGTPEKLTKTLIKTETRTQNGRNTSSTISDISSTNPDPICENNLDYNGTPGKLTSTASKTEKNEGKSRKPTPTVSEINVTNSDLVTDNTLGDDVASGNQKQLRPKRQSALKAVEKIQLQGIMQVVDDEDSKQVHSVTPKKHTSILSKTETKAQKNIKPSQCVSTIRVTEPGLVLDKTHGDDEATGRPKRQSAMNAVEKIQLQEAMEVIADDDSLLLHETIDCQDPDYEGADVTVSDNEIIIDCQDPNYEGSHVTVSDNEIDINDDSHSSIPPRTTVTKIKTPAVGKKFKKKCNICSREFWDETNFKQHRLYWHHKVFIRNRHLLYHQTVYANNIRTHMRSHNTERPHQCNICAKGFKTVHELKLHMGSHSTERPHQCKKCEKGFKTMNNLRTHMRSHSTSRPHLCNLCDKGFKTVPELKLHMFSHSTVRAHHCNICDKIFRTMHELKLHMVSHSTTKPHHCNLCDKGFRTMHELKLHMISHSTERPHQCKKCEKEFKTTSNLRDHMRSHSTARPHLCNICDKRCKGLYELNSHMTSHSTERPHQCKKCEKGFETMNNLRTHMVSHSSTKPHHCNLCDKGFRTMRELKLHMISHSTERPHQCKQCKKEFKTMSNLRFHMRSHNTARPHLCNICDKRFKCLHELNCHMTSHSAERPHQCKKCEKGFKTMSSLRKHMVCHSIERPHQCNICDKGFKTVPGLKLHMISHSTERPYQCNICDKRFKNMNKIKLHMNSHTTERPHQCQQCEKGFKTMSNLRFHMLSHSTARPHICNLCDKGFKTVSAIKRHMLSHNTERAHQCKMCKKGFKTISNLRNHMRSHSTARPHLCNVCDKGFKTMYEHNLHMTIHSNERPHQCEKCQKGFKTMSILRNHMPSHSTERPHQCNICDKRFKTVRVLKQHMVSHSAERPYQCNICDKGFKTMHEIKRHMVKHSTERPHHCKKCEKGFKTMSNLRKHMLSHSTERPHRCNICDKGFKTMCHLRTHILSHSTDRPHQ